MQQKSNSLDVIQACNYLKDGLKKSIWKNGEKLPNYRILAEQAKVGRMVMLKALTILHNEKLVTLKKRAGIYAGETIPIKPPSSITPKKFKWQNIHETIKKDILEGRFQGNEYLPSIKELGDLYRGDYTVLRKAVDALVKEEILDHDKRRYRIRLVTATKKSTYVIYLVLSDTFFNSQFFIPDQMAINELVQSAEKECMFRNIRLVKTKYAQNNLFSVDPSTLLGFIVMHSQDLNPAVNDLMLSLTVYKKPIAVYIYPQSGTAAQVSLLEDFKKKSNLFVSDITSDWHAGFVMGRFLFNKGYTKAYFFTWGIENHVISERYTGLCEAFMQLNLPNAIVPIVRDEILRQEPELFTTSKNNVQIEKDLSALDKIHSIITTQLSQSYGKRLEYQVLDTRMARDSLTYYQPLFKKALTQNEASVWVCADDHIALYGAMDFCNAENLKIPGRIGLVGFGDLPESKVKNLTSYHFDVAGAARKMISLIMYPEYAKKSLCIKGTNVFEVDGMIIDRGSA